jgi:hypothetical protein
MTNVPVFVPGSIYSLLVLNSSATALFHYMGGGCEADRAPWERAVAQARASHRASFIGFL